MKLLEEMLKIRELQHSLRAFTHIYATKKKEKTTF
jgi:hypothetical protein